jgi:hypothetical protein
MAFLVDDALEGTAGVAIGLATGIVVGLSIPGVRPVAKAAIKGGLAVTETVRGTTSRAWGQFNDLVAEAQAERVLAGIQEKQETDGESETERASS